MDDFDNVTENGEDTKDIEERGRDYKLNKILKIKEMLFFR